MTKVKICGLRREEDIAIVNEFLPDYAGFILAEGRKRTISEEQCRKLTRKLRKEIKAVGVFVNQNRVWIAELLEQGIIDVAQLHGQETEADVVWIKQKTGKPVIKAVSVQTKEDIEAWNQSQADYILLDQGNGGTGQTFDWNLTATVQKPFFLAGGIRESNVIEALLQSPAVLDVSSGVETDEYKDREKVRRIIRLIRKEA